MFSKAACYKSHSAAILWNKNLLQKKRVFLCEAPPCETDGVSERLSVRGGGGQASQGELLFIWNEPLGKHVTWHTGPGQLLKWTGSGKKWVGEEKKAAFRGNENSGLFQHCFILSPPSLSHIERAQKVFGYINTPALNARERLDSYFLCTHTSDHSTIFFF